MLLLLFFLTNSVFIYMSNFGGAQFAAFAVREEHVLFDHGKTSPPFDRICTGPGCYAFVPQGDAGLFHTLQHHPEHDEKKSALQPFSLDDYKPRAPLGMSTGVLASRARLHHQIDYTARAQSAKPEHVGNAGRHHAADEPADRENGGGAKAARNSRSGELAEAWLKRMPACRDAMQMALDPNVNRCQACNGKVEYRCSSCAPRGLCAPCFTHHHSYDFQQQHDWYVFDEHLARWVRSMDDRRVGKGVVYPVDYACRCVSAVAFKAQSASVKVDALSAPIASPSASSASSASSTQSTASSAALDTSSTDAPPSQLSNASVRLIRFDGDHIGIIYYCCKCERQDWCNRLLRMQYFPLTPSRPTVAFHFDLLQHVYELRHRHDTAISLSSYLNSLQLAGGVLDDDHMTECFLRFCDLVVQQRLCVHLGDRDWSPALQLPIDASIVVRQPDETRTIPEETSVVAQPPHADANVPMEVEQSSVNALAGLASLSLSVGNVASSSDLPSAAASSCVSAPHVHSLARPTMPPPPPPPVISLASPSPRSKAVDMLSQSCRLCAALVAAGRDIRCVFIDGKHLAHLAANSANGATPVNTRTVFGRAEMEHLRAAALFQTSASAASAHAPNDPLSKTCAAHLAVAQAQQRAHANRSVQTNRRGKDLDVTYIIILSCPHELPLMICLCERAENWTDVLALIAYTFSIEINPTSVSYDVACRVLGFVRNMRPDLLDRIKWRLPHAHGMAHGMACQAVYSAYGSQVGPVHGSLDGESVERINAVFRVFTIILKNSTLAHYHDLLAHIQAGMCWKKIVSMGVLLRKKFDRLVRDAPSLQKRMDQLQLAENCVVLLTRSVERAEESELLQRLLNQSSIVMIEQLSRLFCDGVLSKLADVDKKLTKSTQLGLIATLSAEKAELLCQIREALQGSVHFFQRGRFTETNQPVLLAVLDTFDETKNIYNRTDPRQTTERQEALAMLIAVCAAFADLVTLETQSRLYTALIESNGSLSAMHVGSSISASARQKRDRVCALLDKYMKAASAAIKPLVLAESDNNWCHNITTAMRRLPALAARLKVEDNALMFAPLVWKDVTADIDELLGGFSHAPGTVSAPASAIVYTSSSGAGGTNSSSSSTSSASEASVSNGTAIVDRTLYLHRNGKVANANVVFNAVQLLRRLRRTAEEFIIIIEEMCVLRDSWQQDLDQSETRRQAFSDRALDDGVENPERLVLRGKAYQLTMHMVLCQAQIKQTDEQIDMLLPHFLDISKYSDACLPLRIRRMRQEYAAAVSAATLAASAAQSVAAMDDGSHHMHAALATTVPAGCSAVPVAPDAVRVRSPSNSQQAMMDAAAAAARAASAAHAYVYAAGARAPL